MLDKNTLWSEICAIFEEKNATAPTLGLQNDLMNQYMNVWDENPEIHDGDKTFTFQDRMNQVGSHIGVNNPGQQGQQQVADMPVYRQENGDKEFVINFVDKMISAAMELRKYVTTDGSVDLRVLYAHNTDQYASGNIKPYDNVDAAYLMKMKDVIDLLSLSFLYYNPEQFRNSDDKKAGITMPVDQTSYYRNTPKTYRNVALGALKQKADLSENPNPGKMNPSQYQPYNIDYAELKDYIINYLTDDKTIINTQLDGTRWKNDYGTGYFNKYGIENKAEFYAQHKDMVQTDYFKNIADKMFRNVYGIDLNVPETLFTYGNQKLADDTLVINFTSAHRCPAWDNCLVKNACYAKASEHGYKDLFAKNKNVNMMWEGSRYDPRIMDALKAVIRSYLINYQKVGQIFNINPSNTKRVNTARKKRAEDAKRVLSQQSTDNQYSNLGEAANANQSKMIEIIKSHEGFNQLSEEQLAIIRNPESKILRAKYIRLNEEGDFIGQWLVDAIDEFAGELKKIGVSVAAYTCRNLNYDKIKNIIINASTDKVGAGENGVANAVARRFYAVPEDFYNSLDETYAPSTDAVKYDQNGNPMTEPIMPTLVKENGEWHIVPFPQPVYSDESGENRNDTYYYYKCPCGRGKKPKEKKTKSDPSALALKFNTIDRTGRDQELQRQRDEKVASGKKLTKKDLEEEGKSGINCYDCRMCYQPKWDYSDKPVVVYVQVHSTEKELFNYKKQKDTGYSKGYQQNRTELGLNEEIFNVRDEDEDREIMAIQQVTNNAINSVNEHLREISQGLYEQEEKVKNNFKLMLERLDNTKF